MATTVLFYVYGGDPKVADKSGYLSATPTSKSCALTQPCDIEQPELTLAYDNSELQGFNYCYISDFGRYYFITAKETDSAGQLHMQLQSDPLYTWVSDIEDWDLVISRSGQPPQGHSTYTRDPLLPLAADRSVKTYKFAEDQSPFNIATASSTAYNYVLNVAGREQS